MSDLTPTHELPGIRIGFESPDSGPKTDYVCGGHGGEQTKQAGNAVPVNVAQWIASRLLEVL